MNKWEKSEGRRVRASFAPHGRFAALAVFVLAPALAPAQGIGWLDFTGLDDSLVQSASGQDFEFDLDTDVTVTVTLRSSSGTGFYAAADHGPAGSPFHDAYEADLPVSESVEWSVGSGGVNTNLFVIFSQPVDVYLANSGWTTDQESISATTTGVAWALHDDPPSDIEVTGEGTGTIFLTSNTPTPSTDDYMVAESLDAGALILTLTQNEFFGGSESIAIGVLGAVNPVPEPRAGILLLSAALLLIARRRARV